MRLTFRGTRGSLPKPGPSTLRYGGDTSCVQVETAAGTLILLDCGTGAHALGQELLARGSPTRGHILLTHTHWDHIQGIPFFTPLFVPGNEWDVYGPRGFGQSLQDTLAGQMQYLYFPVALDALGAKVGYHNLVEGVFDVDEVRVRARYLNHPALTLGYRLEVDGVSVVYACDHEPHARELAGGDGDIVGQDLEHAEWMRDADLVIHDAQYTAGEYPSKVGWGHGTPPYAARLCRSVGVSRLALTHHDPMHDDATIDGIVGALRGAMADGGPALDVFAAAEGMVIELERRAAPARDRPDEPSALRASTAAGLGALLVCLEDDAASAPILAAATAEDLDLARCDPLDDPVGRYGALRPALVILDGDHEGSACARAIRSIGDEHARDVPIIVVASRRGVDRAVTDWLVTPVSTEYARSRIRAWLLRVECRWARAPLPDDEERRLQALHGLRLLDTDPEERFDRIARLAAAVFDVPATWVSLVDAERQFFKSRIGFTETETHRDAALCSHTILEREPMS